MPMPGANEAAALLSGALDAEGFSVSVSCDFEEFAQVRARIRPGPVSGAFDPEVTAQLDDAFWLGVVDAAGAVVGLQAMKRLGTVEPDLRAHIIAALEDYVPPGAGVDLAESRVSAGTAANLSGRLAYHGEGYMVPRRRGVGVARPFIRLGIVEACARWDLDGVVGILVPATDNPSFARVVGYRGYEADAFEWRTAAGDLVCREGLVWSGRTALRELVVAPLIEALPAELGRAVQE